MAIEAISSTINNTLVPLLSDEVKFLGNIHKEVASIKAELECIRALLKDAHSGPELKNERAEIWVKQVGELAHEIEDVMDEYMLHLAEKRQRHGFIGFLRKLTRSITKLKIQHDIASQIKDIRLNIGEIKKRADTYGSSIEYASSSRIEEKFHYDPRAPCPFVEEDEFVRIEPTKEELIHRLITEKSNRTVTSLVGMGGCGKSTLAKKAFDYQKVRNHFDCQAWVSISQSYKLEDIFRKIMKQLCETREENEPAGINTEDQNSLIHMLRDYLLHKRYLIVFDDVWSPDFWRFVNIALPKNNNGSQIIVTTRREDVASFTMESSSDHIYKVKPLSEEEAWKLFCMKTFQWEFAGDCPIELEKESRAILTKCEGLPLAIVTIGATLSTKRKDVFEWQKFYNSLGSELERNPHLTNVMNILLLSYRDLPYYLKSCFLYFSIIPEDYQITRGRLIRLWIAEGFIEAHKGKTLEEVAEEHLTELVHRSMVQVSSIKLHGRIKRCQVHDIVHEIILIKCKELSFCQILGDEDQSWNHETRRWSMQMRSITNMDLETMSSTNSRIRSVFIFSVGELPKNHFLSTLATNFKLMKVLDLENAPLDELHKDVGHLVHLRYLSVKKTKVKIIPKSIGNLHNLLTLNFRDSQVSTLQNGILNRLRKLRHLIALSEDREGLHIKGGIGHLVDLQAVRGLSANDDLIKELEKLMQLRKLGIVNLEREQGKALCTAISKMKHLQSLRVRAIEDGEGILDFHSLSSPPESLRKLSLNGGLETLPNWISKLSSLVYLGLYQSRLTGAHTLKSLQALPNLIDFYLFDAYDGEQLYLDVGGFPKLKELFLISLKGLNSVIIEEGALSVLKKLVIGNCPQLKEVPSGIRNLKELNSLYFDNMPTELLDRMQPSKEQDYQVIQHIPTVEFRWIDGGVWLVELVSTPQEFQDKRESKRLNNILSHPPSNYRGITVRGFYD